MLRQLEAEFLRQEAFFHGLTRRAKQLLHILRARLDPVYRLDGPGLVVGAWLDVRVIGSRLIHAHVRIALPFEPGLLEAHFARPMTIAAVVGLK